MDNEKRTEFAKKLSTMSKIADPKINKHTINLFCAVGGGDGSYVWGIEELLKNKADFRNIITIFLPFGTGNDLGTAVCHWSKLNNKTLLKLMQLSRSTSYLQI